MQLYYRFLFNVLNSIKFEDLKVGKILFLVSLLSKYDIFNLKLAMVALQKSINNFEYLEIRDIDCVIYGFERWNRRKDKLKFGKHNSEECLKFLERLEPLLKKIFLESNKEFILELIRTCSPSNFLRLIACFINMGWIDLDFMEACFYRMDKAMGYHLNKLETLPGQEIDFSRNKGPSQQLSS